ncbi:MAG: DUF302 domain-containing protein [Gammaproteobacteria bacterium]|nr:MAG: DUF302 domain-containing protein [Gammaproteobacteria bacterium]
MRSIIVKTLLLSLVLAVFSNLALADYDVVKKLSHYSVPETMDRLESTVTARGLRIFARIDHEKNATAADMTMNPAQLLIFGNPKMGTLIMKADPAAGLDLPLRVLVYRDDHGKVWLAYHDPKGMKDAYDVGKVEAISKASAAMDKITTAVTAADLK